jgi:SOS-response transcriptional repressor LexA
MDNLHPTQRSIFEIAKKYDLQKMGLRKIARLIGETYPQTVKYHIAQLKRKGFLNESLKPKYPQIGFSELTNAEHLVAVPIIGAANCGEANIIAEENLEGFLRVSPKVLADSKQIFVIRAEGDSMNRADVYGRSIEDGDYVLVDGGNKMPQSKEYVVSVINGMANIKKFVDDKENNQVILFSESTEDYPPICIHEDDLSGYLVAGVVKQVIKPPKVNEMTYEPISR